MYSPNRPIDQQPKPPIPRDPPEPKRKRKRRDPDLVAADREAGELLAADADSAEHIRHRGWKERALGGITIQQAKDSAPDLRWGQVRMGAQLAALCAHYGAEENMSREGWMRQTLARECSRRSGIPVETLLAGMRADRPRSRHDNA
jgi:hypothetical protein